MPRYIETAPGSQINYDFASEAIRKAADLGTYKISDAIAPPTTPTPPAPVKDTPTRTPSLLEQAKQTALVTEESQRKIREEADLYAASQRQARIDAINTTFAPRLERAKEQARANQSRVDAINFNKGNLGSGFDTAAKDEQKNLDEKALRAIEDEKATLINSAFEYADQLATQKRTELSTDAAARASSNVAMLTEKAELAKKALEAFGKGGVTSIDELKTADLKTYETLRDVGGLSDFEMIQLLNQANPKMNAQISFSDGIVYQYYTDPKTGQIKISTTKAEGVPANYKPQFAPDGTLIFMPDKFDPSRPISEQVIQAGNFAKPKDEDKSFLKLNTTQKTKLSALGFDPKTITSLEGFLQTHTIDEAMSFMESGGQPLSPTQKAQLKAALTGDEGGA